MTLLPSEPTQPELVALLERVAREDAAALRALYELTAAKLFGVALRILVKREWAEEALQDAFINIWRYAGDYRVNRAAPLTWMTAIVRNRALDFLRRQKTERAESTERTEGAGLPSSATIALADWSESFEELLPGDERDPADSALLSEAARQLAVCMKRLDANQRQAVALAYLRDQSHGEIAQTLSVPLGTVKSWVRRGLEKLKLCMGGQ
ncbi:MAG: polymerase sigma-70 factor, subfamily [Paraburkholderia sp.]|jgi:RNA polymerase sigma-70 factor (ECF subfamily)|nr:polymerase sigma-70 factor, subfamily [Paraburkholderia sp.]